MCSGRKSGGGEAMQELHSTRRGGQCKSYSSDLEHQFRTVNEYQHILGLCISFEAGEMSRSGGRFPR